MDNLNNIADQEARNRVVKSLFERPIDQQRKIFKRYFETMTNTIDSPEDWPHFYDWYIDDYLELEANWQV